MEKQAEGVSVSGNAQINVASLLRELALSKGNQRAFFWPDVLVVKEIVAKNTNQGHDHSEYYGNDLDLAGTYHRGEVYNRRAIDSMIGGKLGQTRTLRRLVCLTPSFSRDIVRCQFYRSFN